MDITERCAEFAQGVGGDGLLHVFVPHATAGIAILETGAGSDDDLLAALSDLLPADDRWRQAYARSSAVDTDGGAHPQNLFRLINRQTFRNFTQETTFTIRRLNLSRSPNRNQSNGVLLFEHYRDGDNLYYAGVRVDGAAVVKKKLHGTYHTLGIAPIYPGAYDRNRNPNLLPVGRPVTIRTETQSNGDGSVEITLFVDGNPTIHVRDGNVGGPTIAEAGFAGIRTDFMDVDFASYSAEEN
jgi:hypothetical protein